MRSILWIAAPALAVPLAASPLAAQTAAPATEADLTLLANFFLPAAPFVDLVHDGCTTAYRTKLGRNPADQQLERDLPGVHERMIAAASAVCDGGIQAAIARWHARIKTDWQRSTRTPDLARLARLFGPATREAQAYRVDVREGEALTDAVKRRGGPTSDQEARFRAAQAAFARTPGGSALLNRVSAYQRQIETEISNNQNELMAVIQHGLAAAHRAANAYAAEKGFSPPFAQAE